MNLLIPWQSGYDPWQRIRSSQVRIPGLTHKINFFVSFYYLVITYGNINVTLFKDQIPPFRVETLFGMLQMVESIQNYCKVLTYEKNNYVSFSEFDANL